MRYPSLSLLPHLSCPLNSLSFSLFLSILLLSLSHYSLSLLLSFFQFPILTEDFVDVASTTAAAPPRKTPKLPKSAPVVEMPPLTVAPGQTISMELSLALPEGTKLTEDAPSFWSLSAEGTALLQDP